MIAGVMRILVFGLLGAAALYVIIALYSRSVRRERLEKRADEDIAEGALDAGARDDFIERGMEEYERSLRPKLIFGVFVIPFVVVVAMIYVTNFM